MVVDALDLCYTKGHVDTFVIVSGDSDFSPLVSKLRENAKKVVGVGVKNSTSDLFIKNCDEFLYYDDLVRTVRVKEPARARPATSRSAAAHATSAHAPAAGTAQSSAHSSSAAGSSASSSPAAAAPSDPHAGPSLEKALVMVAETLDALSEEREEDEHIWASMIKQALKRRNPGFNERAYGFRSFNDLLHEAQHRGLLKLARDEKSGGYTVRATP